jgi:hypothetical protein
MAIKRLSVSSRNSNPLNKLFLLPACVLQLFCLQPSYADFINGGFEDTYTPDSSNTHNPITGWTQVGYTFGGAIVVPPGSLNDITLTPSVSPGAITDIIAGPTQTLYDYFLFRSSPPLATLLLPIIGTQSVMINLRSIDAPLAKSGTIGTPPGWAVYRTVI